MVMTPRFHRSLDKNHASVIGTSKWQVHLLISGSETLTHPQVTIVHTHPGIGCSTMFYTVSIHP